MLFDAKKLWIEGGYGLHNDFAISMNRIHKHGTEKNLSSAEVDVILVEFFLELREEPRQYMTDDYSCFCG